MTSPAAPPVSTDDLVTGCVTYLKAQPDIVAALGSFDATNRPWLFPYTLFATVQNSQSAACVVNTSTGWAAPNQHNTMRFPRLTISIYADPLRDDGNNITDPGEVQRRIDAIYRIIDAHLHRPQGGAQMWGSHRTINATRLGEPFIVPVTDGNGLQLLTVSYGVAEG